METHNISIPSDLPMTVGRGSSSSVGSTKGSAVPIERPKEHGDADEPPLVLGDSASVTGDVDGLSCVSGFSPELPIVVTASLAIGERSIMFAFSSSRNPSCATSEPALSRIWEAI
jgi:hypothetical protein